jgi:hypothetical protein
MYVKCHSFQTCSQRDELQLLLWNLDIVWFEGGGQLKKEDIVIQVLAKMR